MDTQVFDVCQAQIIKTEDKPHDFWVQLSEQIGASIKDDVSSIQDKFNYKITSPYPDSYIHPKFFHVIVDLQDISITVNNRQRRCTGRIEIKPCMYENKYSKIWTKLLYKTNPSPMNNDEIFDFFNETERVCSQLNTYFNQYYSLVLKRNQLKDPTLAHQVTIKIMGSESKAIDIIIDAAKSYADLKNSIEKGDNKDARDTYIAFQKWARKDKHIAAPFQTSKLIYQWLTSASTSQDDKLKWKAYFGISESYHNNGGDALKTDIVGLLDTASIDSMKNFATFLTAPIDGAL
jgi:hypothetical protein